MIILMMIMIVSICLQGAEADSFGSEMFTVASFDVLLEFMS